MPPVECRLVKIAQFGSTEMTMWRIPLVGVHIVHQVDQRGILEAVVAEQLAGVAPVVLFDGDIGVVLVGA